VCPSPLPPQAYELACLEAEHVKLDDVRIEAELIGIRMKVVEKDLQRLGRSTTSLCQLVDELEKLESVSDASARKTQTISLIEAALKNKELAAHGSNERITKHVNVVNRLLRQMMSLARVRAPCKCMLSGWFDSRMRHAGPVGHMMT